MELSRVFTVEGLMKGSEDMRTFTAHSYMP